MGYRENMKRDMKFDKRCTDCGAEFVGASWTAKYCVDCKEKRVRFGRVKAPEDKLWHTDYPEKLCVVCGELYLPTSGNQKYCAECRSSATKARREATKRKKIEKLKQQAPTKKECTVCREKYAPNGNNQLVCERCYQMPTHRRVAFREKYPTWECERCGKKDFESLSKIQIHHKNRVKTDNSPDNLEMLCSRCHRHEHIVRCKVTGKILTNL